MRQASRSKTTSFQPVKSMIPPWPVLGGEGPVLVRLAPGVGHLQSVGTLRVVPLDPELQARERPPGSAPCSGCRGIGSPRCRRSGNAASGTASRRGVGRWRAETDAFSLGMLTTHTVGCEEAFSKSCTITDVAPCAGAIPHRSTIHIKLRFGFQADLHRSIHPSVDEKSFPSFRISAFVFRNCLEHRISYLEFLFVPCRPRNPGKRERIGSCGWSQFSRTARWIPIAGFKVWPSRADS